MTFDLNSTLFFLAYVAVTTVYGVHMKRQGILMGINDTLLTLSESKSDILKAAMSELEQRAIRKFKDKE
jgi:hypothetical protein